MKTIDTKSYLSALCELIAQGQTVSTIVTGDSMVPFLGSNRDTIYLSPLTCDPKKGDVVLFRRESGDFVLHRICRIRPEGYFLTGDRQTIIEGPVPKERILACATSARRKGRLISRRSPVWIFYRTVWLWLLPLRPAVFALRSLPKKLRNKKRG
ncbi:MAG: S24/S26 family peptidase [Ruminococcus sp.]|nr:S24/S26 family peptidase [Ruminococcus sp.]MBQ9743466.1 S24/S26 family peptidase [Ruminococcus sp.]